MSKGKFVNLNIIFSKEKTSFICNECHDHEKMKSGIAQNFVDQFNAFSKTHAGCEFQSTINRKDEEIIGLKSAGVANLKTIKDLQDEISTLGETIKTLINTVEVKDNQIVTFEFEQQRKSNKILKLQTEMIGLENEIKNLK